MLAIMFTHLSAQTPEAVIGFDTLKVCEQDTITLNASSSLNAIKYSWQIELDGKPILASTSMSFDFQPADDGFYTVILTVNDQNSHSHSDTAIINSVAVPKVLAGQYDSVCNDNPKVKLNRCQPKGATGKWYYIVMGSNHKSPLNGDAFIPRSYKPGIHYLLYEYSVPNSECRSSDTTLITVNELPRPYNTTNFRTINGVNKLCIDSGMVLLSGGMSEGGRAYVSRVWSGRGVMKDSSGYYLDPKKSRVGSNSLAYQVMNLYGCMGADTIDIYVDGVPELAFSYRRNGKTVSFYDSTGVVVSHVKWNFSGLDSSTLRTPVFEFPKSGTYPVTLSSTDFSLGLSTCPDQSITKDISIWPTSLPPEKNEMHVFPNPGRSIFEIKLPHTGDGILKVYNTKGEILIQSTTTDGNLIIDLSEYLPGLYHLKFIQNGVEYSQTLVKI